MKIINGLKVKEKKYSGVLMVLILSFLLHLIPIFIVKTPTSGPDEVLSLASAAKLAGYDWSYLVTKFGTKYGCGSAWYLAPLFYFITNGKIIYNLARTVLAFILEQIPYTNLPRSYPLDTFWLGNAPGNILFCQIDIFCYVQIRKFLLIFYGCDVASGNIVFQSISF